MKTFDESQLPQLPVETVDEGELVQHQPSFLGTTHNMVQFCSENTLRE